jgi:hypothetical protein
LDIEFTPGTSCERAAPLAEKNAAARHHVLRSLISLHNEHRAQKHVLYGQFEGFSRVILTARDFGFTRHL